MTLKENLKARDLYRKGWSLNGEWKCPECCMMIGKNLLGDKPYLLAMQHAAECAKEN